jgi:hypothetical protein
MTSKNFSDLFYDLFYEISQFHLRNYSSRIEVDLRPAAISSAQKFGSYEILNATDDSSVAAVVLRLAERAALSHAYNIINALTKDGDKTTSKLYTVPHDLKFNLVLPNGPEYSMGDPLALTLGFAMYKYKFLGIVR